MNTQEVPGTGPNNLLHVVGISQMFVDWMDGVT